VVEEVRTLLRRHDLALTKVQRPRRKLESLFLEIVEQARSEGVRTSGASSGGEVAEFLAANEPVSNDAGAAAKGAESPVDTNLLDSLMKR
jgi:hypothetical protein